MSAALSFLVNLPSAPPEASTERMRLPHAFGAPAVEGMSMPPFFVSFHRARDLTSTDEPRPTNFAIRPFHEQRRRPTEI